MARSCSRSALSASTWPPERPGPAGQSQDAADAAGPIAAAVLVPIHEQGGRPHLVLTKRRSDLRRHAGEISFPGGRRDLEDTNLQETALREAEEEIGLQRGQASVLGELPSVPTLATNYVIHPFVATIPFGVSWQPSEREVEQVLELGLSEVREAETMTTITRRGIKFETHAYVLDGHVWGATARIIQLLLERLQIGTPGALTLQTADTDLTP
jgi:8-oxo-dGTP pyrophosphatase MutT (NUDIX family)